jgi:hypothetical protein
MKYNADCHTKYDDGIISKKKSQIKEQLIKGKIRKLTSFSIKCQKVTDYLNYAKTLKARGGWN